MTTSPEHSDPRDGRVRRLGPRTLALGAIAAVLLAAIFWSSGLARRSVRIPLAGELSQLPDQELVAVIKGEGVTSASIDAGCLVVSTSDEARCRQILQELSADETTWADEWQRANDQLTPFSSASERSAAREIARARRISQMLSEMPGIEHADIVWDEQAERGFRQAATVRATVYIRPSAGSVLTTQVVESIREAVAGSKANLDAASVIVMDLSTGMTHRWNDEPSEPSAGNSTVAMDDAADDAVAVIAAPAEPPAAINPVEPIHVDDVATAPIPSTLDTALPIDVASLTNPDRANRPITANAASFSAPPVAPPVQEQEVGVAWVNSLNAAPAEPATFTSTANESDAVAVQPARNRSSSAAMQRATSAWKALRSRKDFHFIVWAGLGIVVVLAVLKSLGHPAAEQTPPDLNITQRPLANDGIGLRVVNDSPDGTPAQAQKEDARSSQGEAVLREVAPASNVDADPLAAFEHLAWLDAATIQKLYRCLPDEPWALALSGASSQIQEHVLKSLSRSSAALLQRRMDSLPAIRLRDVEAAQLRLAEWIGKLDESLEAA